MLTVEKDTDKGDGLNVRGKTLCGCIFPWLRGEPIHDHFDMPRVTA